MTNMKRVTLLICLMSLLAFPATAKAWTTREVVGGADCNTAWACEWLDDHAFCLDHFWTKPYQRESVELFGEMFYEPKKCVKSRCKAIRRRQLDGLSEVVDEVSPELLIYKFDKPFHVYK